MYENNSSFTIRAIYCYLKATVFPFNIMLTRVLLNLYIEDLYAYIHI